MSLPQYHMQRLASSKSCFIAETLLNPDDMSCLTCPTQLPVLIGNMSTLVRKHQTLSNFMWSLPFLNLEHSPMLKTYSNMLA